MHMYFVWQGHDSKRKIGVSLQGNDDFTTESLKKNIRFFVFQSRTPRLIFDDSSFDSFANPFHSCSSNGLHHRFEHGLHHSFGHV